MGTPIHLMAAVALFASPIAARAQSVQDLQRQIDELRAELKAERAARVAQPSAPAAPAPPAASVAASVPAAPAASAPAGSAPGVVTAGGMTPPSGEAKPAAVIVAAAPHKKGWYEKLQLRGYTQVRYNRIVSGDDTAPTGISRLRSVHDSSITEKNNFSLRRARLVVQGEVSDRVSLYFQTDFASAVNAQSNGERRENYGQLRDAYVDVFVDKKHEFKLRVGQSKVPFGWENLQSSANRLTLDRSDAINSATISERDLGVVGFYTPRHVQDVWDRLSKGGQKLFGNYGAFGVALYNGQGINRTEQNNNLMKVAMATWPFELDALGSAFEGQVLEVGASGYLNKFRPEVRTGGVSGVDYKDNRVGVHAILYPQPFGLQAEWNWGRGPEYDTDARAIRTAKLKGGYVQAMYNVGDVGLGKLIPYGRWQYYRGGWKSSTNAPRLETNEIEVGLEWQLFDAVELTLAYANMKRREADERRVGQAKGNLIRTQFQFNY